MSKIEIRGQVESIREGYIMVRIEDVDFQKSGKYFKVNQIIGLVTHGIKRTIKQNNLYWDYCNFCGCHLGCTKDEIHEGGKALFLSSAIKSPTGNGVMFPLLSSTANKSISEFGEYWMKLDMRMIEMGVPTHVFWEEYEQHLAKQGKNITDVRGF